MVSSAVCRVTFLTLYICLTLSNGLRINDFVKASVSASRVKDMVLSPSPQSKCILLSCLVGIYSWNTDHVIILSAYYNKQTNDAEHYYTIFFFLYINCRNKLIFFIQQVINLPWTWQNITNSVNIVNTCSPLWKPSIFTLFPLKLNEFMCVIFDVDHY